MAQFNKNDQDFLNQERTLFEVNMIANKNGEVVTETNRFPVSIGSSSINIAFPDAATTAFDEPLSVTITPVLQGDMVYGKDPDFWNTTELNNGAVTVTNNNTWEVGSGTSAGGYARLATARYMTYQPGQGSMFR